MKRLSQPTVLILIAMILTTSIAAQTNSPNEREQGYYILGFNGGVAYQQGDVSTNLSGIGFGITYGKNLVYAPNGSLSLDLRSRFQIARSFGQDIRPSLGLARNEALNGERNLDYTTEEAGGLVYANYKTNLAEVGLEGVLTLNGLREATGVGLSFTGGIGLDWYKITIDQSNTDGLYSEQYNNIDAGGNRSYNLSQLKSFLDGKYETTADGVNGIGNLDIMPSLGIELDYDLTPNLALGIGHRMTFSGTDVLDGQRWTNSNILTGNNDILHYTSLGLKYTFNQREKIKRVRRPTIDLIQPYGNDLKTNKSTAFIKAKVNDVDNPFDVYLTVNGEERRFTFNSQTLTSQILLQYGKNQITISATNQNGTTEETFFLFSETAAQSPILTEIEAFGTPDISFINPAYDGEKVENSQIKIRAKIRHLNNRKAIEFRVNGKKNRFDFDKGIAALDAVINLKEGKNIIEIRAKNNNGERQLITTVFYEASMPYPSVKFIRPAYTNTEVERDITTIEVVFENIRQSTDIQLFVNRKKEEKFYFEHRTGRLTTNVLLKEGRNEIEVVANNIRGEVRDQVFIIYKQPYVLTVRPPRVSINAPNYTQSTTSNELVTIHATLTDINRKSEIRFTNNGQIIYDFQFNPNTGVLKHNLYLRAGINQVVIEAQNEAGRDAASATINFELPLPPPVVINAPSVAIFRPRHNDIFEEREISIKASLLGITHKDDIELSLNRNNCLDFRFNPTNGKFRANLKLREGENIILIKVGNPAGVDREKIIVFYERRVAPEIDVRQPNFNRTEKEWITLKAITDHIENKRDIRLTLNNRPIRDFQLSGNRLEAKLRLVEGRNDIEIIAENNYGMEKKQIEVDYFILKPPSVSFVKPIDNQTTSEKQISLEARVENVSDKKDIRLFINGRASGNFDWSNEKITGTINLKEGRNTISLRVKTQYGRDEANLQINYQQPKLPSIDFISHHNKEKISERNITLKASLKNVDNKADIILKVNGKKSATFTFKNGVLRSPIRLQKGENMIILKVETSDGKTTAQLKIHYKSIVNQPVVSIISPNKINKSTQHTTANLKAVVENVNSKKAIQLFVNGKTTEGFQFDPKSGELSAIIALKLGLNIILVRAENEGGIVESNTSITQRLGRPSISKRGKIKKVKTKQ